MTPDPLRYSFLLAIFLVMLLGISLPSFASQSNEPNLVDTANTISRLIAENHYNPEELKRPEYLALEKRVMQAAISAKSNDEFLRLFNDLWRDGPFSHVNLAKSDRDAAATAEFYDTLRIGGGGAALVWQKDVAVLTVNTMMGADTIEEISAAYDEIVNKGAKALIIDLRNNEGGAFAIVPLVSHLLKKPLDAGIFVSRKWNTDQSREPTLKDIASLAPWTGWSIKSFWRDVQTAPLTRVQFVPIAPQYLGPVYILTSQTSASATEFATDALANLAKVTIIGEPTAGKMLSQKMFDVSKGIQLALPIAEYYSTRIGRIEGKGVTPTIAVPANQGMKAAMEIIAGTDPKYLLQKLAANPKQEHSKFGNDKLYLFGSKIKARQIVR